ncbi:MAG: exodeoxyribonuclease VII large subunit [Pseudomonadota bacterium]
MNSPQKNIVSVSQLNRSAKQLLQTHLGMVWVRGEISGLSRPASGHWYFTIKDQNAQISCAMFKGRNALLKTAPSNGDQVLIRGNISLYEPRGNYQLIAEHIEAEGEGRLRQAFEALKQQLHAEGLFDAEHKQALPNYPRHIAIVSSSTGAAVHDMCSVLKRRWPLCKISLFPCAVQGEHAPAQICHALSLINTHWNRGENKNVPIQAIIVGRGGGSLEDLQAFNEESVARAVFNSHLPVISAVGHEVDFCICDFVADQRAPTPSVAAELLCADQHELSQTLDHFDNVLNSAMRTNIVRHTNALTQLNHRMRHPQENISFFKQRFIQTAQQLKQLMQSQLNHSSHTLTSHTHRLMRHTPSTSTGTTEVNELFTRLSHAIKSTLSDNQLSLQSNTGLLNTVSPLATLQRGYAIAADSGGHIISSVEHTQLDNDIQLTVSDGSLTAKITSITPKHVYSDSS